MAGVQGSGGRQSSIYEKTLSWIKNIKGESESRPAVIQGENLIPRGQEQLGKKLSDRAVSELDQGFMLLQEHGVIREASSHAELDNLTNRYNNDDSISRPNREALMAAINSRREVLGTSETRH